jgi:hypothetical protein
MKILSIEKSCVNLAVYTSWQTFWKNETKKTNKFKVMRKIILLMLFITTIANAQEYKLEAKSITGTFDVKEKTKSEIFSLINKWISTNYNSSKNVIQMNDLESGTIIIKGINEIEYKNVEKVVNPNFPAQFTNLKFNHLIEINIKDNKFRIIYKIIDNYMVDNYVINDTKMIYVNFDDSRKLEVEEYNALFEENMKKVHKNKEKRERYLEAYKLSFEEINTNLINDMKNTMLSVEKSVSSITKDGW